MNCNSYFTSDDENESSGSHNIESEVELTSGSTSVPPPKQPNNRAKTKLVVQDHFTEFKDPMDGEMKGKCNHCGDVYMLDCKRVDTNSLKHHIDACKPNPHEVCLRQTQLSLQPVDEGIVGSPSSWKYDEKEIREALTYMIIVDELPFKFVEGEGFKKFMEAICPMFNIPSRWTITQDCYQLYLNEKLKLRTFFKNSGQRVSLTVDTWTTLQSIHYMCITAHYIDNDWKLNKKVINFCPISSLKGKEIGRAIEICLLQWDLDKIFTVTVDNASSNDIVVGYLRERIIYWKEDFANGKYIHMRCIPQIVNLIVNDGLKELSSSVMKVREAIRYIRSSPARLQTFKECCFYERIQSKSSLCLDVQTRWDSTYQMLSTAEKFEKAFERYDSMDLNFKRYLEETNCPTCDDWEVARKLAEMLRCFYELILRISCSRSATCNIVFTEIYELLFYLLTWQESTNKEVKSMGDMMRAKFDKYWGDVQKMNKLVYVAVILDPRDKLEYMEYALQKFHGNEEGTKLFQSVKDSIFELFNEYKRKYEKENPQSSDNSPSSLSHRPMSYFKRQRIKECGSFYSKSELEVYLGEYIQDDKGNQFDVLNWWKINSERFPILGMMARDVLAVPVSTMASESAFCTSERVLDSFKSSLTPKVIEALICVQDWLKTTKLSIEEELEQLDKFEETLPPVGITQSCWTIRS